MEVLRTVMRVLAGAIAGCALAAVAAIVLMGGVWMWLTGLAYVAAAASGQDLNAPQLEWGGVAVIAYIMGTVGAVGGAIAAAARGLTP